MTTYTRKYVPISWHYKHWILMFLSAGMWAPFYWLAYRKARRPILEHFSTR